MKSQMKLIYKMMVKSDSPFYPLFLFLLLLYYHPFVLFPIGLLITVKSLSGEDMDNHLIRWFNGHHHQINKRPILVVYTAEKGHKSVIPKNNTNQGTHKCTYIDRINFVYNSF